MCAEIHHLVRLELPRQQDNTAMRGRYTALKHRVLNVALPDSQPKFGMTQSPRFEEAVVMQRRLEDFFALSTEPVIVVGGSRADSFLRLDDCNQGVYYSSETKTPHLISISHD